METLIPLLIAVILSAVLSKKKKQRQESLPEEKTTLPSSPWDDLIRELQQNKEQPSPSEGRTVAEGAYDDEMLPETSAPVLATASAQSAAEPSYYSYDEQAIDELDETRDTLPFSYDDQALSEMKFAGDAGPVRAGTDSSDKEAKIEKSVPASGIFDSGFDPKMAVLYAEVMRPKFREYQ